MTRRASCFKGSIAVVVAAAALAAPAARAVAPVAILTGRDQGWPTIRGWNPLGGLALGTAPWGTFTIDSSVYPTYQSGVRVAVGDVNGDGRNEIVTAPGEGGFTELRVFDGKSYAQLNAALPFKDAAWWNGAFVAVGDVNGDGHAEIIDGLDTGCCTTIHTVEVATGRELAGFWPYGTDTVTGVSVAAADLDGDGRAEILAVQKGSATVSEFGSAGGSPVRTFQPFAPADGVSGGISSATGDLFGDRRPELAAVAATAAGTQVRVLDVSAGATLASYVVSNDTRSVATPQVAVADVDGDHAADIVVLVAGPDGTRIVSLRRDGSAIGSFYVLEPGISPGTSLAAGDLDGDGRAEIVLGGGPTTTPGPQFGNGPDQKVAVYHADGSRVGGFAAYPGVFQGGVRVALVDTTGDGRPELVTAPGPGLEPEMQLLSQDWVNGRDRGTRLAHFLAFERGFRGGVSIAAGDVNGDGRTELVAGAGPGRPAEVRVFDASGSQRTSFTPFEAPYDGGVSVAVGDLDDDGVAEIVVGTLGAPARFRAYTGDGRPLGPVVVPLPGAAGLEVAVADVRGTGRGLVVAADTATPSLALVDALRGGVARAAVIGGVAVGLRVGAGDLDADGRQEVLVATAWGGDSEVRILDAGLQPVRTFAAFPWTGGGVSIAGVARLRSPLTAYPRTVRYRRGARKTLLLAQFRDFGPGRHYLAAVSFGDGSGGAARASVLRGGLVDVRAPKRYRVAGRFPLTVTLTDDTGRRAVARGTAVVR